MEAVMPVNLEALQLYLKYNPQKGPRRIVSARRFNGWDGKIVVSVLCKSGVAYNARLEYLLIREEIGEKQAEAITRFVDQELGVGESLLTNIKICCAG
jgi:hypothetical protein